MLGKLLENHVLLARDWVANYDRLLMLSMSDIDAYSVDRFAEVGDAAVTRYAITPAQASQS